MFNDFFLFLNTRHPRIKFTTEMEKEGKLAFLDLLITRNEDQLCTKVYRKPTHTQKYIHWRSNHPKANLLGILKGLVHRAHYFCDRDDDLQQELKLLENVFIANGYPERLVMQTIKQSWSIEVTKKLKKLADEGKKEAKKDAEYFDVLNVPYVAGFTEGLQKKLNKLQVGVTAKKGVTLYNHLCKLKPKPPIEQTKNVVYAIPCGTCGKWYIGETGQYFIERSKQHKGDIRSCKQTSAFFCHTNEYNDHTIRWENFMFLAKERGPIGRKITESVFINALNPSEKIDNILNIDKGLHIDKCWHFFSKNIRKQMLKRCDEHFETEEPHDLEHLETMDT
jgi:hypothetical protein